jgi:hypothetical protein
MGGRLALAVFAAALALVGGSASAGGHARATDYPVLVLDRFEARFDNVNTTHYTATVSSKDNVPVSFTWRMVYLKGRCGNFTVVGGVGAAQDTGTVQTDTSGSTLNGQGYFVGEAGYNHDGCPFDQESGEQLTLEILRREPGGASCTITYSQFARERDEPSVPQESPSTTARGDCTYTVNPPPPPPQPPPPPPSATAPGLSAQEKEEWRLQALRFSASGAASGGAALALLLIPEPVSKGGAAVTVLVAGLQLLAAEYCVKKWKDPPDPNYKVLARAAFPRPARVRAGGGVTAAEAAALNALLRQSARIAGDDAAFLASIQRADGAHAAGDAEWDKRQSAQAAAFARAEAALLAARPALEAALAKSVAAAGFSRSVTVAEARTALARPAFPPSLDALLRAFGLRKADVERLHAAIAKVPPAAAAGPAAAKLAPARLASTERAGARLLQAIAERLARR